MFAGRGDGPYNRGSSPGRPRLDAPVSIPRSVVPSVVFLRSAIPEQHPSAAVLGDERMGVGVAIAPRAVLTAHYLVMGASEVHVGAFDGRERAVRETAVDHETGFALLHLDGPDLRPSPLAATGRLAAGAPVFLLTCQDENERKGASGHVMVVGPFEAF